jgi:PAS domain S-box-containing protein
MADEWMTMVLREMPLGVVIHDRDGRICAVNPAACTLLGVAQEQLIGLDSRHPRWQAVREDGSAASGDEHPAMVALRTGQPVRDRVLGIADGRLPEGRRWLSISAIPEFLPGAADPQRVCVLFEDITARQVARRSSSEAEERFHALFAHSPIGIAHHRLLRDSGGRAVDYLFLDANRHFIALTGIDPRGRRVTEVFPGIESDPFDWIGRYARVVDSGESMRVQQQLAVNDRWYDVVGYRTGPDLFAAAFIEISEQKHAEQALRASEENLRITVESIGDAVIATDSVGRVMRLNRVAERLTGWTVAEAAGRPLGEVFRIVNALTRAACEDPVAKVLASGQVVGLANHTVLLARGGREYQIADSGAPIRAAGGTIVGVVLVFRDVTEEHALQEQLAQSRKLDALGQLAGGVAHDFNNMLAGIMSAAELLGRHGDDVQRRTRLLEVIATAAGRAADLTRKLLAFARKGTGLRVPVPVHEALLGAVALLQHTIDKRVVVRQQFDARRDLVEGDLAELQSVFLNLGLNAAHAMPGGGLLEFGTRETIPPDSVAQGFELDPGPYLEVTVHDSGCGIPAEVLPRIFDPFFTTKAPGQGTGLGLTAAYGTIRHHRGAITVASEPGQGTTFTLLLPLVTGEPSGVRVAVPGHIVRGHGRVLVVDDEEVVRATAAMMLNDLGYQVETAADGEEALRRFAAARFDAVLLDVVMPVMDGPTCCRRLRTLDPQALVVLCSGYSHDDDQATLHALGAQGVLRKPYQRTDLASVLAQVLEGRARL